MDRSNLKDMNPDKFPLSGAHEIKNPLEVMQPGEKVVFEIKRHPGGILGLYAGSGALLITMAVLIFVFLPGAFGGNNGAVLALGGAIFFIVAILIMLFTFISTVVYWGNHWILTSDSLTQISQMNVLRKQSAQLALESLEDVSAEKKGVLAHLFNYGTLHAETAGEREKFVFSYCPNPDYYATKLLETREMYDRHQHDEQRYPSQQSVQEPKQDDASGPKATIEQIGQAALTDFDKDQQR